ncbi:YceK/YidQ family lipoprotein [Proteus vulgaris]|uniref:YceK/YidQ family lipoprotein n=1 Tax=Proteus vulgaris TaxID=585 RepID=UPI003F68F4A5
MTFRTTSKNLTLLVLLVTLLTGCSSVMTHAGPNKELYSGKNNMTMLKDNETGWAMKPLVILDLPFSAVLDTLLLPYDYYTQDDDKSDNSPKER